MKNDEAVDFAKTVNRSLYGKLYKKYCSNKFKICDRGKWHHRCNRNKPQRTWKKHRSYKYKLCQE